MNSANMDVGKLDITALFAGDFAGSPAVKVVLARIELHHFARFGDFDALRERFVGLQFHTRFSTNARSVAEEVRGVNGCERGQVLGDGGRVTGNRVGFSF